jgi:hypothetical protein
MNFGNKGFTFSLDSLLALIIVSGIILSSGIFFTEKKAEMNFSLEMESAFNAMEETAFLLTEVDSNVSGAPESIYDKLLLFFPEYFDFNVSIKQFDLNSTECRIGQTFNDCFPDYNEFTFGSEIPSDKTVYHGKKILMKKQPPGECDTNILQLMGVPEMFFPEQGIIFFDGGADLNFVFDINVTPSDSIECDQNITISLSASFPPGYRRPVDIMLVVDKSGSMSWGGRYSLTDARGIDLNSSNYAFVADSYSGLRDLNVQIPLTPAYLGRRDTSNALDVFIEGLYAFVADASDGIEVINISNPVSPTTTDSLDVGGTAYGITKQGNYAFAGNGTRGVDSYNVSNPNNISNLSNYNTPGTARGLDADGSYLYVADSGSGLRILNISNPNSISNVSTINVGGTAYDVKKTGNYAYVANGSRGLDIIDVTNPAIPVARGNYNTAGTSQGIAVVGNTVYIADGSGGLYAIDVSNVNSPSLIKRYQTPYTYYDVRVQNGFAFIAAEGMGLITLDLTSGTKMDAVHASGNAFIDFNEWKPSDQMGIASFNTDSTLNSQLKKLDDTNKTQLKNDLNAIMPGGGTDIESGIRRATTELTSVRGNPYAIKFQVVLSDGQSTEGNSLSAAQDAATEGIVIYTIGFGGDVSETELQNIANATDGNYYYASDANALMDIYNLIADKIQAQATDSNVTIVIPANITIIEDGNATLIDGNLVFNAGNITPETPWTASYIINIPCDSNLSCETSSISFPGQGSYLAYVDVNGVTQIIDWNAFTVPIPFKKRDITVDILNGEILSETDIFIDVNVSNIGDLNTGETDLNFYLGNDSVCSVGAGRILLGNHHLVPELCGGNDATCSFSTVLYNEYFSAQGIICAEVNPNQNLRECPNNNLDSIHCYLAPKTQFYVIEYSGWIK